MLRARGAWVVVSRPVQQSLEEG